MRAWILCLSLLLASPVAAQSSTTFAWVPGQEILLAADTRSGLKIGFEPGETIARISVDDDTTFAVQVMADGERVLVRPNAADSRVQLDVFTDKRFYRFRLSASAGAEAVSEAVLEIEEPAASAPVTLQAGSSRAWEYELRGDREVRPVRVSDDGARTTITYGPEQALPAVFAIGPTGDEEVVNGHMRDDRFIIDRVHAELVFRIDDRKATARRKPAAEEGE
jgi:type IV secretion system protein VirB9